MLLTNMFSNMFLKVTPLDMSCPTLLANKAFSSVMCYHMCLQMFLLWKSFTKYSAAKWVFSSMSTCMYLQITTSYKSSSTFQADQWFSFSMFCLWHLSQMFCIFFALHSLQSNGFSQICFRLLNHALLLPQFDNFFKCFACFYAIFSQFLCAKM